MLNYIYPCYLISFLLHITSVQRCLNAMHDISKLLCDSVYNVIETLEAAKFISLFLFCVLVFVSSQLPFHSPANVRKTIFCIYMMIIYNLMKASFHVKICCFWLQNALKTIYLRCLVKKSSNLIRAQWKA